MFLGLSALAVNAQSPEYLSDLDNLYASVKKLPSYKAQIIKEEKTDEYQKLLNHLKTGQPANSFEHFYKLAQLIVPLKDNHLYLSEISAEQNFPFVNIDLAKLEKKLKDKKPDDVEGIYYYNSPAMKLGLYRTAKKDSLIGVVLATQYPNWRAGQIAFVLKEYAPNRFRNYFAAINEKTIGLLRNEKFMHGTLTETRWKKFPGATNHVNIGRDVPTYQFKTLSPDIQYLRLGSFASNDNALVISQKFFDTYKDSITAKNLIVDLRNNGGGGYKSSEKFMKLLQDYATNRGRIYVMVNNRTVSNAEQFTVRIKKSDNVTLLGETTNGMIAYGNNNGVSDTLPGKRVRLYITDMPDYGNYVRYEDIGITPDVFLKPEEDWVGQVVAIIKKK